MWQDRRYNSLHKIYNTAQSVEEQQITTNETLETNLDREYSVEEIEQRVGKRLDERLTKQLAEWQDNILHTIREIQTIATKSPEAEISCVEEKDRLVEAIHAVYRLLIG